MTQNAAKKLLFDAIKVLENSPKDVISLSELSLHMMKDESLLHEAKNALPVKSRLWFQLLTAVENKLTMRLFKKEVHHNYVSGVYKTDFGVNLDELELETKTNWRPIWLDHMPTIAESAECEGNPWREEMREALKEIDEPKGLKGYVLIQAPYGDDDPIDFDTLPIQKGFLPIIKKY